MIDSAGHLRESFTIGAPAGTAPSVPVHALRVDEVHAALSSRPGGLPRAEVEERLRRHGPNAIREVRGKPLSVKFLANFTHLMAILLWVGGAGGVYRPDAPAGHRHLDGQRHQRRVQLLAGVQGGEGHRGAAAAPAALRPRPARRRGAADPGRGTGAGRRDAAAEGRPHLGRRPPGEEAELRVDQSTLTGESHPVRKTSEAVAAARALARDRDAEPGLCRDERGGGNGQGGGLRHRHGDRVRQDRPPDPERGERTEPAAEGDGAGDQGGHRDGRRRRRASSSSWRSCWRGWTWPRASSSPWA